jgi:hypothetical protein
MHLKTKRPRLMWAAWGHSNDSLVELRLKPLSTSFHSKISSRPTGSGAQWKDGVEWGFLLPSQLARPPQFQKGPCLGLWTKNESSETKAACSLWCAWHGDACPTLSCQLPSHDPQDHPCRQEVRWAHSSLSVVMAGQVISGGWQGVGRDVLYLHSSKLSWN